MAQGDLLLLLLLLPRPPFPAARGALNRAPLLPLVLLPAMLAAMLLTRCPAFLILLKTVLAMLCWVRTTPRFMSACE